MTERIRFHFDPLCPWAWQSFKWIREVEAVRDIQIEWRLFSLYQVNDKSEKLRDPEAKGSSALRTLALLIRQRENAAVASLYRAIGERVHDGGDEFSNETVRKALVDVGLDEELVQEALDDDTTVDLVLADHNRAVDEVGCFGVPTIILPSGKGMFGPVVTVAPTGEEAGEMWDHVRWLIEHDEFFEIKRERGERRPGG